MICKECGIENNDSAKFCKACGAKLEMPQPEPAPAPEPANVFCQQCGTENSPTAAFCKNCGSPMAKNESAPHNVPQSEPERVPQSASATVPPQTPEPAAPPQTPEPVAPPQSAAPTPVQAKTASSAFQGAASTMSQAKKTVGPKFFELLKMTFTSPFKYVEKVRDDESYWQPSAFVVLVTSFLLSFFTAFQIGRSGFGNYVNPIGTFFMMFFMIIICALLSSTILFASEKIFGGSGSFKNVIGAMGPFFLLVSIGLFVTILFSSTDAGMAFGILLLMFAFVWGQIILWKAHELISGLKDARMVYSLLCYIVALIIVLMIVISIAGGAFRASMVPDIDDLIRGF